jgi:hypothetical protein
MTAPSQEPDPFAPGEPRREIVLVALGAVVLGRRAFPARNDADQLLLLLALVDGVPVAALASILALDPGFAGELMEELETAGLAETCEIPEEIEEIRRRDVTWTLTDRGRTEAAAVAERVARLLPSWPPGSAGRPGIGEGRFHVG